MNAEVYPVLPGRRPLRLAVTDPFTTPEGRVPRLRMYYRIIDDDLVERNGGKADAYQRAEYLKRVDEQERNGGRCPACGAAPLEIRVPGLPETA